MLQHIHRAGGHAGFVELAAAPPVFLGMVHGGVGAAQQGIPGGAVLRKQTDADGRQNGQRMLAHRETAVHEGEQLVGHLRGVFGTLHVGEHHHKFIATQPRHYVGIAHALVEPLGHMAQQLVACIVAQRVVHGLEVVEVHKQHRSAAMAATGQRQHLRQLLHEEVAVGQPGQRVVQRDESLALLRLPACGDVAHHHDAVVSMLPGHGLAHHLYRNLPAVLVADDHFIRILAAAARVFECYGAPFGANEVEDRLPDEFLRHIPQQAGQRVVPVGDDPIAVEDDGFMGRLGELAHALFALAHGAFGPPVLGDVDDQHEGAQLLPGVVEMRDQVHLDHALVAARQGLLAGVLDVLASCGMLHMGLDIQPGLVTDRLLHGEAQDGFGGVPVVGGEALVGKAAAQRGKIEVRHQRGHRIGNQAQQWVVGAALACCIGSGDGISHAAPHTYGLVISDTAGACARELPGF